MPTSIPTLCGSIMGHPFSLNVKIHNAAYQALGLDYTFVCFGVEDVPGALTGMRSLGIRGMNVSMPHKSTVIPLLDELDPAAKAIGAVNTIHNRDGRLIGYNTDYLGAVRALEEVEPLNGQRVAILGAGGAARAVAYGVQRAGAQVTLFNRSAERARALAADLDLHFGGTLEAFDSTDFDILINATSVGFRAPDANPLQQPLASHLLVMDVAFIPSQTRLLQEAENAGCRTISGTRMLVHQACGQVELYTGQAAPFAVMEQALLAEVQRLELE